MQINIGEKITDLRTKKNVTLEKFAQFLGITVETLNAWENGESYPPLEAVVALAGYFGVTTDELLCVEQFTIEDRIKAYTERYEEHMRKGMLLPAIDTMREALTHFPDDYNFKYMLMYALYVNCDRKNTVRFTSGEIITLGEDILAHSDDDTLRVGARRMLILHYCGDLGDTETAMKYAESLPDRMFTREEIMPLITEGDAKKQALRENIAGYTEALIRTVKDYAESGDIPAVEQLGCFNFTLQLARLTHPAGDYLALSAELMDSCKAIAALHMAQGENEKALDALEAAAHFAAAYDRMPRAVKHTSPMLADVVSYRTDADEIYSGEGISLAKTLLDEMLALSCFEPLRYSDKMKDICAALEG